MTIPDGDAIVHNIAWIRTHMGKPGYFNFTFNKDGTISPEDHPDLVFGLDDASVYY